MATATEQLGRTGKDGEGSTRSRVYQVLSATSEQDAINTTLLQLTADLSGTMLDGLSLLTIVPSETETIGVYDTTCTFGQSKGLEPQEQSEVRTSFEFGEETIRAKVALSTTSYGVRPPNHKTFVGVTRDENGTPSVEGMDIPAAILSFSKTVVVPLTSIDNSFLLMLGGLSYTTNANIFAGFPVDEVLFAGVVGAQKGEDEYELTYRFKRRKSESITIEGIADTIQKKGWEYVEILHSIDVDEGALVPKARAAYVHQLFESNDFAPLNL